MIRFKVHISQGGSTVEYIIRIKVRPQAKYESLNQCTFITMQGYWNQKNYTAGPIASQHIISVSGVLSNYFMHQSNEHVCKDKA